MRRVFTRIAAGLIGILAAIGVTEMAVRTFRPYDLSGAGHDLELFRGDQDWLKGLITLDPELGFRPEGGSYLYDDDGFLHNDYDLDEVAPGKERILFLGDSVTRRAKIVDALRARYGEERFEYWNAGVTAYNTAQEYVYYVRYAERCQPDHVVLTFHLNDFLRTPISFVGADGRMHVISPYRNLEGAASWLFRSSHLYRYYAGATPAQGFEDAKADIIEHMRLLKERVESKGARLSVIVMPNLAPRRTGSTSGTSAGMPPSRSWRPRACGTSSCSMAWSEPWPRG